MVYMHFPHSLTEEEEQLQKKYAILKKKKKILAALRAAARQEPQQPTKITKKRPSEAAANATEQAKKLLKSGAIKVEIEKKDQQNFKRSKRQKDSEKVSVVGFQPFNTNHSGDVEEERPQPSRPSMKERRSTSDNKSKWGYNSAEKERYDRRDREPPKQGCTIYVKGRGLDEDILRKAFSNIGDIVNITLEQHKDHPCGFVMFEKMDSAKKAIEEMNRQMVGGVCMQVSMARNQPSSDAPDDASINTWAAKTEKSTEKGPVSVQESRDLVDYTDPF